MAFDQRYVRYALTKIDNGRVRIYDSPMSYQTIFTENAVFAIWAYDVVNVYLADGSIRRYDDFNHYQLIF